MKLIVVTSILLLIGQIGLTQNNQPIDKYSQKGNFYFYWGWNRGWYSKSDIKFRGSDYDFELKNVIAKDRQSALSFDPYFHPGKFTIPQYNFRVGYFLNPNWNISFGIDHMKYVVKTNQYVEISGVIEDSNTGYKGEYSDDLILIENNFLKFEHTDGLNYINTELRRFDKIVDLNKVKINLTEGFGIGALVPRTNTNLLNKERYDEFHLSGFGLSSMLGINVSFFDVFFVQTEFKGGYINMPNIRTTNSVSDKANQSFFFTQFNILFGITIKTNNRTKANNK